MDYLELQFLLLCSLASSDLGFITTFVARRKQIVARNRHKPNFSDTCQSTSKLTLTHW